MPPRRAMVSDIRRPEIAVIFATTIGSEFPMPSFGVRSTSIRLEMPDRLGTINTSS